MNKHLKRFLETKSSEHKEDIAREKRNYGQIRPAEFQTRSYKTWKSYSGIRRPSEAYRQGYDLILW